MDIGQLHDALKEQIKHAQSQYQLSANTQCFPAPKFTIGSSVFVKAQFFRSTWPSKKLAKKFLGPYKVIARAGTHSYTLWLPDSMYEVHPVFHVSMLEPVTPNTIPERVQLLPPPIEMDGEPE